MRAGAATVVDLAAYLGVTPARVRQIIAVHDIAPVGTTWKAKLYDPREVFRHAEHAVKRQLAMYANTQSGSSDPETWLGDE